MVKMKYIKEIRDYFKKNVVVSIYSLKRFLISKGASEDYVYQVVNMLLKRHEINRVIKGFYSIYDDPTLIVYCLNPAYIGLESALSFHNLWEQETNINVITPGKLRTGVRTVFGANLYIHHLDPKYFFGYDFVNYYDFKIPVSDVEKTLLDLIYFKHHISQETVREIKKVISMRKLKGYLRNYHKNIKTLINKKLLYCLKGI